MSSTITGGIPPIPLRVDGAEAFNRVLDEAGRAAERFATRTQASQQQLGTLSTVADSVNEKLGTLSTRAQAASVVLERMGAGQASTALTTFSSVLDAMSASANRAGAATTGFASALGGGAGLVSRLGLVGLAVGGAIAVVRNWEDITKAATNTTNLFADALGLSQRGLRLSSEAYRSALAPLEEYAAAARRARGEVEDLAGAQVRALQTRLMQASGQVGMEVQDWRLAVTAREGGVAAAQRRLEEFQTSAAREARLRGQPLGGPIYDETVNELGVGVAQAIQDLQEARREVSQREERIRETENALANSMTIGRSLFQTPSRSSGDGGGGSTGGGGSRQEQQPYGPLDGSRTAWLEFEGQQADAAKRAAEREARALEQREDQNRRVTDRIVDYSAERFADLFDENGAGWDGMWETMERTAKSTIARIAAEAVIRPIISPIVDLLGLGGLGNGNGGFSGLFGGSVSGLGGMPSSGSAGSAGGLGGLLNLGGGGSSGGGMFGGLGGLLTNPVWQPGAGWFASAADGTNAALAGLGEGVYGPAQQSGLLGTSLGSYSLGSYAAGIGGGYMAGSTLGGFLAKSKAQQQNSQIGAGVGAAIGAIWGPVGAMAGGALGGAVGGLLGPSSQFSGGDVGIGVDAGGFLTITGAAGKRFDDGAARQQSQQQIDQLNAVLRGSGVTIQGAGGWNWERGSGLTLGMQGYGGSNQVFGPTEIWNRVSGSLTASSNSTLSAALRQPWMQSFEDLGVIAPFASENDNLTRALGAGSIRSRVDFNSASEFITGVYQPMIEASRVTNDWVKALNEQSKAYNDAIARAQQLGLAENELTAARDRSRAEVIDARDRAVGNALGALRVDELRAGGNTRQAALLEFDLSARERRAQTGDFLESFGYVEGGSFYQQTMARLDALAVMQRKTLSEQLAEAAKAPAAMVSKPDAGLMQEMLFGESSGMTGASRYAAGVGVLERYRRLGDLEGFQRAAPGVIATARVYLGTSERYGDFIADARKTLAKLGGDPDGLMASLNYQARTADGIDKLIGVTRDELRELRAELRRQNAVITALLQRKTA